MSGAHKEDDDEGHPGINWRTPRHKAAGGLPIALVMVLLVSLTFVLIGVFG